mmetsp:Transcript_13364/g.12106  ORF Transcript_13364/g.12106 Transcript_13364/m.12106 type:complete len:232 (+) Transcript_13364:100-795(+)
MGSVISKKCKIVSLPTIPPEFESDDSIQTSRFRPLTPDRSLRMISKSDLIGSPRITPTIGSPTNFLRGGSTGSSASGTPRKSSITKSKTLDEIVTSPYYNSEDNLTMTPHNNLIVIEESDDMELYISNKTDTFNMTSEKKFAFICSLCQRKFATETLYNNHCQFSKVHHIALLKCINGASISKSRLDINDALNQLNSISTDDLSGGSGVYITKPILHRRSNIELETTHYSR